MKTKFLLLAAAALTLVTPVSSFAQGKMEVVCLKEAKRGPCDPNTPQLNPSDHCRMYYFRGNPETEENYGFIEVKKGGSFPPHWHTSDEHVVVIS
jgi:hypothetical protein